jgi:hypothetical protein
MLFDGVGRLRRFDAVTVMIVLSVVSACSIVILFGFRIVDLDFGFGGGDFEFAYWISIAFIMFLSFYAYAAWFKYGFGYRKDWKRRGLEREMVIQEDGLSIPRAKKALRVVRREEIIRITAIADDDEGFLQVETRRGDIELPVSSAYGLKKAGFPLDDPDDVLGELSIVDEETFSGEED